VELWEEDVAHASEKAGGDLGAVRIKKGRWCCSKIEGEEEEESYTRGVERFFKEGGNAWLLLCE